MAITIRTEINLTARFVMSTEAQANFVGERAKLRVMAKEEPGKIAAMSRPRQHLVNIMVGDMSDEEVLKVMIRSCYRDYCRDGMGKEMSSDGMTMDRIQAKVSFADEDRGCDCRGNYTCMGCRS